MRQLLHLGLLINPLAGLGGSLGLKGSDGPEMRERYITLDEEQRQRGEQRVIRALNILAPEADKVRLSTWAGDMGENALSKLDLPCQVYGERKEGISASADTAQAARTMKDAGVDVLLFAGGDGTARDIFDAIGNSVPVLGIPAGVKMHSGVFAVSPEAAGELLLELVRGGLVGVTLREVRDIDEEAFREDRVNSRYYGELAVPGEGRFLQHTKVGGRESEELVAAEIAAYYVEQMSPDTTYLIGPGSTTAAIMEELGLPNTLLGVDVVRDSQLLLADADESALSQAVAEARGDAALVVTAIGGQGYVFGRGNQQFSPAVIRAVGTENIVVVAAKSKITALQGRPLLVDTNDPELDRELSGYRKILTGYDDHILYRLATID
jgi:predicted polyphosphate/ATP-dependent NAD kinase